MSEKSPSFIVYPIKAKRQDMIYSLIKECQGKICNFSYAKDSENLLIEVRENQTLAEVLEIAKRFRMYNYDGFVEEIKNLKSKEKVGAE